MHISTRTLVLACTLSAALFGAGCGGDGEKASDASGGEVFLEPVAAEGPDPFTDSTARITATPSPVAPTPSPAPTAEGVRSVAGGTPGLYGGTHRVGSCDVERQVGFLTADQVKARAFARAAGVSRSGIPAYLRGLTSVVLRADTRVTNHGFRDGRATGHQSVLQAGTAVLVDNRGVPRVRCACGNPLKPPVALDGTPGRHGSPWSGYRPTKVIVVTPEPQVITDITIINVEDNTWIERRIGDDGDEDRIVPPPAVDPQSPDPDGSSPSAEEPSSDDSSESSDGSPTDCVTPTVTVTPGTAEDTPTEGTATENTPTEETTTTASPAPSDCPTATVTATPEPSDDLVSPPEGSETDTLPDTDVPDEPGVDEPGQPEPPLDSLDSPEREVGPDTVPDSPDVPDDGGLIPDEPGPYRASGAAGFFGRLVG
ncbi:DUF6777 domain-containing protein [Streptomyces sp. NPDC050704]|uniref:DUF6777 domain-containing protein n=1 Tax=Streptomyces sp. NPDC050704 TaxID=3157219 RepID=UPI0034127CDE